MFLFKNTTNMTQSNGFTPPIFSFSLPSLRNPSTMSPSAAFNVVINDQYNKPLYTWDQGNQTYSLTNNGIATTNSTGIIKGPVV